MITRSSRSLAILLLAAAGGCQREREKPASPAAVDPGPGICQASDLALALAGSDAGAGQRGMTFSIQNSSRKVCRTGGYPTLRLTDSLGENLDSIVVRRESGFPDSSFLLAPDSLASFQITFTGIPAGITCYQASRLDVIPPGASDTLRMHIQIAPCGDRLNLRPMTPGVPPV